MTVSIEAIRKFLQRCCPEWRERLEKFVMTGDLDQETSDHLDACPTCTAATDTVLKHLKKRRKP